ncbi:MAG: ABC transporter permease [Nanoarchaeota archaeon]|nr:ABC transporter permease [Nanoarchaeota archaeon]
MGVIIEGFVEASRLILTLDPEIVAITWLSLKVSVSAVVLGFILAMPIALALSFYNFPGKQFLVNIVNTLMGLPPVVVGLFVYLILSASGPLGFMQLLYSPAAMIIAQLIIVIPIIAAISYNSISSLDSRLKETAVSLGANNLQAMWLLIMEARKGIVTSIIAGFGAAISEVGAIFIVGGNIRFHTRALTTAIMLETRRGQFELAIALGIILLAMAFAVNIILTRYQARGIPR